MTRLTHHYKHVAVIVALVTAVACGGALATKQQIGIALKANGDALALARTTELALYQTKKVLALTPEKHLAFIDALLVAQRAQGLALQAYVAWDPTSATGVGTPQAVLDYKAAANNVVLVLTALGASPDLVEAVQAANRLVDEAQKLIELFTKKGAQ